MWFYFSSSIVALIVAVVMVFRGNPVGLLSLILAGVLYAFKNADNGVPINVITTLGTHRWILLTIYVLNKFGEHSAEKKRDAKMERKRLKEEQKLERKAKWRRRLGMKSPPVS